MRIDLARQLNSGAHQHRRPDHAVKAGDVLADHVDVARPVAAELLLVVGEADSGQVVRERGRPRVADVVLFRS